MEIQEKPQTQKTEGTPTNRRRGVIREVWYGKRSLAETFWGWGVLFNVLLVQNAGPFMVVMLASDNYVDVIALFYLALIWIPLSIWVIVGLWRSATNHAGLWAGVVKILVVIAIMLQIAPLAMFFGR